jgi:hypothetical protein
MRYLLLGRLQGELSTSILEPIVNVAVRFYRLEGEAPSDQPLGREFSILSADQLRTKAHRWIGQARTNDSGEFAVDLTGGSVLGTDSDSAYNGGPLEVDVYCTTPQYLIGKADSEEVQFTAARIRPEWLRDEGVFTAVLDVRVSHEDWRTVRTAIDAWAVTGRVIHQATRSPIVGARVSAFDADLILDDSLGTGVTDSMGRFQIEFRSLAFRSSRYREIEFERSGPDLYFRVDADDGRLLIAEPRSKGSEPSRRNAGNLVSIDILVD